MVATIILLITACTVSAQGEFSSNSFYNTLLRVKNAGQTGFDELKGRALKSAFSDTRSEYYPKVMLPLADSGKVIIPNEGLPYTIYYFEPEKKKDKIDVRAADLRSAVLAAYKDRLVTKTISTNVNNNQYSDTYFYTSEEVTHTSKALFRMSVFPLEGKYYLTIEVRGVKN